MTFDILIPMYNEEPEVVLPLLKSIDMQRNIDLNNVNIYIGFDGSDSAAVTMFDITDSISSTMIQNNIHFLTFKHEGISATRNKLFEAGDGDYVAWCDCDDSYSDINALSRVSMLINACIKSDTKPDIVVSDFWEEVKGKLTGNMMLCKRISDTTFVHGKFYSREFLTRENIRWNNSLTIHEDSYFNGISFGAAKYIVHLDDPIYTWCWNPNSVARRDPLYMQKTTPKYLKSILYAVDDMNARGLSEKIKTQVPFTVSRVFYRIFVLPWDGQEELRDKYERYFADFWNRVKDYWEDIDSTLIERIFAGARNEVLVALGKEPVPNFDDWIKHIESLEPLSLDEA